MAGPAKDFLDHLRLIHFSIVIVASTVVITTLDSGSQDTRRDLSTVTNIVDLLKPLAKRPGPGYGSLEQLVHTAVMPKEAVRDTLEGTLRVRVDQTDLDVAATFIAPSGYVFHGDPLRSEFASYSEWSGGGRLQQKWFDAELRKKTTMSDALNGAGIWKKYEGEALSLDRFRGMWNELDMMRHGYTLQNVSFMGACRVIKEDESDSAPIQDGESTLHGAPSFSESCAALTPVGVWTQLAAKSDTKDIEVRPIAIGVVPIPSYALYNIGEDAFERVLQQAIRATQEGIEIVDLEDLAPGDIVITGKALYVHVPLNIQGQLLAAVRDTTHIAGGFDQSFPGLSSYLAELRYDGDVAIRLASALVARDAANSGGPVELAVMKISRSAIAFWGLVILACFQLYFVLHLRELIRRVLTLEERCSSAWIAMYPGARNGAVTTLSAVAIPMLALILALRAMPHIGAFTAAVALSSAILNAIAIVSIRSARALL